MPGFVLLEQIKARPATSWVLGSMARTSCSTPMPFWIRRISVEGFRIGGRSCFNKCWLVVFSATIIMSAGDMSVVFCAT